MNLAKHYVYTMNEAHGSKHGFSLSRIPLGGNQYIISKLQQNLDNVREVIANICKLKNVQEKLILLLQCIPGRI